MRTAFLEVRQSVAKQGELLPTYLPTYLRTTHNFKKQTLKYLVYLLIFMGEISGTNIEKRFGKIGQKL